MMDTYNYLVCSALRGGHPDIENNAPWYSPYLIGESPFFTDLFPDSGGEINFDLPEEGGNNNGIQEINETILYCMKNDIQFENFGDKISECGFLEDLLSLYGITGKVENTQTVNGNFLIGGTLSVESGVELTLNDNTSFNLFNSEISFLPSATLVFDDNVKIFGNSLDKIVVNGNLQIGSNVSFLAEEDAQLQIELNNPETNIIINQANFERTAIISNAIQHQISGCTFTASGIYGSNGNYNITNSIFNESFLDLEVTDSEINEVLYARITNNCQFSGMQSKEPVNLENYEDYTISGNFISDCLYGIKLYNCGDVIHEHSIDNNEITNNIQTGIRIYNSYADVRDNVISGNIYGIRCLDNSHVNIEGNDLARFVHETQQIRDNLSYEVSATQNSFPVYFKWNAIIDEDNGEEEYLVHYSTNEPEELDVRYNY